MSKRFRRRSLVRTTETGSIMQRVLNEELFGLRKAIQIIPTIGAWYFTEIRFPLKHD